VRKLVRKRPLGEPRLKREDNNIKTGLKTIEEGGLDWNDMAQDRD
jgi:hypothetical protein